MPTPTIVKVQKKGLVTLPTRLRSQAGITDGDLIEATFQRGKIILTPKPVIDYRSFLTLTTNTRRRSAGLSTLAWTRPMKTSKLGACMVLFLPLKKPATISTG